MKILKMTPAQAWLTYPLPLVLLAVVAVISSPRKLTLQAIFMDPTAYAGIHPLTGMMSNLGILLWCAGASVCLFAALITARHGRRKQAGFLLAAALLSLYLMFDDLFLFHEELWPRYIGISQTVNLGLVGLMTLAFLVGFRRAILASNYGALGLAFVFFSLAVLTDLAQESIQERIDHWVYLIEDGFKWLGIASWCSYLVQTSYQAVLSTIRSGGAPDPPREGPR